MDPGIYDREAGMNVGVKLPDYTNGVAGFSLSNHKDNEQEA